MPPQQGVWRRDRGDLAQGPSADSVRSGPQPTAIVVRQTQPPSTKLTLQQSVLFNEIRDDLPLPPVQPAGQRHQHYLQRGGVNHEPELISWLARRISALGRLVEHYGFGMSPDELFDTSPDKGPHWSWETLQSRFTAALAIAGAILVAPQVPRLWPQAGPPVVAPAEAPPAEALSKVASVLKATVNPAADESSALSMLLEAARGVGRVASEAAFIKGVVDGFVMQVGAAPVELMQEAIVGLASWLWNSDGRRGGGTTGEEIVSEVVERSMMREIFVRDTHVERHYLPAELTVAFTVLFAKSDSWSGPDINAQMQAFAQAWRHEVVNRDCTARVRGGTDTVGRDGHNYQLSEKRAREVARLLDEGFGLAKDRVAIEMTGERGLANSTNDSVDALVNRRVDVRIRCEP